MPVYTFECKECGAVEERLFGMLEVGKRRRVRCPTCTARMVRVFTRPQVRPDTWGRPRELAHLYNLGEDPEGPHPTFETRSEERRYKQAHQEKYGWGGE